MDYKKIESESLAVIKQLLDEKRSFIEELAGDIATRLRRGNKVMACGNGGSAADAQHFAGELVNRFLREREPYAGIALSTDTSTLTAIGNDYGYEWVFAKQVLALGKKDDVLLAISTSGNAANVCRAVEVAKEKGILTVALTGGSGGQLAKLVDRALVVSCTKHTPRIQEGHQLFIHLLCERVEELLVGEK